MKGRKKRKKIFTKRNLKKGFRGSISILLCLIIAPFLSVALALVEYSRYQEVMEITEEVYELTGMSVLSDYDQYIHNRFGLLATSQENFAGGTNELLEHNMKVLGNQASLENVSVNGKISLMNADVLRKQIVDFSELTSTTAIITEDLKLDELIEKLENIQEFQDIIDTVDSLANLAEALTDASEKLETLEQDLKDLKSAVENAKASAGTLSTQMAELSKKLGEEGIALPENATLEQIEDAVTKFSDNYLQDFKDTYSTAKTLYDNLEEIKTSLTSVQTSVSEFGEAVKKARTAAEGIIKVNSVDESGKISEEAASGLESVLEEMESLVRDTLSSITEESITAAKDVVKEIVTVAFESAGLTDVVNRYSEIVNGSYFALPLSDIARKDIIDFLKTVQTIYSTNSSDALVDFFKEKFVPDKIEIDAASLLSEVSKIYQKAIAKLEIKEELTQLLTDLVNMIKGLFDLDLFYEKNFNAYVDIGNASNSSYQKFLDALGSIFNAIDDLEESREKSGLQKIKGALKAMGEMFRGIGDLLKSIVKIAEDMFVSINELRNSVKDGDVQALYEKLLISGYMRHNLPCRLDTKEKYETAGDRTKVRVELKGMGLTGMEFNDIARPSDFLEQTVYESNFQGLGDTLEKMKNNSDPDRMFKGAELEYIRAGTNSEIANQIICFFDIYFLRLLLDLPFIFTNKEVNAVAAGASVAAWVVYILYIVAEPFCDTLLLVNEKCVPLIRTKCWLTASGVDDFIKKMGSAVLGDELEEEINKYTNKHTEKKTESSGGLLDDTEDEGSDYRTHMLIVLFLYVDRDTQLQHLSNLIQLETTEYYRQQKKEFEMSKTYTVVDISAKVTFHPFFDLGTFNGGESFRPSYEIKRAVSY